MLVFLASLFVGATTVLIIAWYIRYFKFHRYLKIFPELKQVPLLGVALEFPTNTVMYTKLLELRDQLGRSFWGMVMMEPILFTADPNLLKAVLSSSKEITKADAYKYLHQWLGLGLLNSDGEKWRSRRKILTPAFHFKILEGHTDTFDAASDILVEKLSKEVGKPIDIHPFVTLCALDIICETAMGTSINAQMDTDNTYVKSVKTMGQIVVERSVKPLEKYSCTYFLTKNYWVERRCLKYLHKFTNSIIREKRKNFQAPTEEDEFGRKKKLAFLDLLLSYSSEGANFSDEDIREEVDTFMFEGHDTTSSGITFALYLLANNPKQQAKVFEEIRDIFSDDPKRPATFKDYQQMKYLEMVIKESLRLYPSVPVIGRELVENFEYDGKILPKGLTLSILFYVLHRDPELYPNPELFDPERFSTEHRQTDKSAFDYVPFSAGPRNCIGQKFAQLSMKSTISKILRNFELLPANHQVELAADTILLSKNGVMIKLKKRQWE